MAILEGTRKSETLDPTGGDNDTIWGYGGDDFLFGRVGNDWLYGGVGNDDLYGGQGNDHMWGEDPFQLDAPPGNDYLEGGPGADDLHGGPGTDTAGYIQSSAGVSVNLATGVGSGGDAEGDTLDGIENLTGSDHADRLFGDDAGNGILGRRGDDILKGFGGADTLIGGNGDDIIDGGAGGDWLEGNNDDDLLDGGAGNDTLVGGSGNDDLYGGAGQDYLSGGGDADTFHWSSSSDIGQPAGGLTPDGFLVPSEQEFMKSADVIMDFNPGQGDRIDLSGIDANTTIAGNQAFTFIGTAAFTLNAATPLAGDFTPGEIRYYWSGGDTYIQMQTDTYGHAEGVIRLDGLYQLEAGWFVL